MSFHSNFYSLQNMKKFPASVQKLARATFFLPSRVHILNLMIILIMMVNLRIMIIMTMAMGMENRDIVLDSIGNWNRNMNCQPTIFDFLWGFLLGEIWISSPTFNEMMVMIILVTLVTWVIGIGTIYMSIIPIPVLSNTTYIWYLRVLESWTERGVVTSKDICKRERWHFHCC